MEVDHETAEDLYGLVVVLQETWFGMPESAWEDEDDA